MSERTAKPEIERVEQLQLAFELSACPTIMLAMEGLRFVDANPAALAFLQVSDVESCSLNQFVFERDLPRAKALYRKFATGETQRGELFLSAEDGVGVMRFHLRRVGDCILAVADAASPTSRIAGAAVFLHELDPLTGLVNRRVLLHRIDRALQRQDRRWGVLFIDLNRYKHVNDAYGHIEGDRVLVEFARKLAASVRPGDLVARFGGDEFVVLVERMPTIAELRYMANRITSEVQVTVGKRPEIVVTASIGCAMSAHGLESSSDIIDLADRDMYAVKRRR